MGTIQTDLNFTKKEGILYDTSFANTLKNMKNSNNFIKTVEDQEHDWMQKRKLKKTLCGAKVLIDSKRYHITPSFQIL